MSFHKIKQNIVVFRLISSVYIELLHNTAGCQTSRYACINFVSTWNLTRAPQFTLPLTLAVAALGGILHFNSYALQKNI
jgi:hypothetical protein